MISYVLIPTLSVTTGIVEDCIQTSTQTIRTSPDGLKSILKYEGTAPSWVSGLGLTPIIHEEALIFVNDNWDIE